MRARVTLLLTVLALLMALAPMPVTAAGLTVNSLADTAADDGSCTLREAIIAANTDTASGAMVGECAAGAGVDTIGFTVAGTITVGSALTAISSDLAILGAGAITVNGGGAFQVFNIQSGTVGLSGLTITNGSTGGHGGGIANDGTLAMTDVTVSGNTAGGSGGGILNNGTLTITDSTISGNTALAGGGTRNFGTMTVANSAITGNSASLSVGVGGGVLNEGTLTVTDSTVSGNSALNVGGIFSNGTLTVTDSTISGNSASTLGGMQVGGTAAISNSTISANSAALHGGGLGNAGALNLTNSTVSGNSAGTVGGGIINFNLSTLTVTNATISGNSAAANGGGINAAPFGGIGTETLVNTIVAGNSAPVGADLQGTIETSTNVLTGDPTGILVPGGVADNGGPTQTIALALVAGNPAIDTAISATCAAAPVSSLDQRGLPRPAACDIGAYEAQPPTVAAHADVTAPATSAAGAVVTYTPPAGTDEQGGAAAVACVPPSGSTFPVGSTTVTCTATDAVGHTATGTFAVVVGALAEPSLPDAAMAIPNPAGSWVALGFGALLIGSLAGLAFVNARGVDRRRR